MEQRIPQNRLLRFAYLMVHRYLRHRVGVQSAALAFYLLFMLFPFLIFVSALLGQLQLDVAEEILTAVQTPEDCMDDGIDARNYGQLAGLPCARAYFNICI